MVEQILPMLESKNGKEVTLVVTKGKVHEYLGMKLDCYISGTCIGFRNIWLKLPKEILTNKITTFDKTIDLVQIFRRC
jgi:hypothetical protein